MLDYTGTSRPVPTGGGIVGGIIGAKMAGPGKAGVHPFYPHEVDPKTLVEPDFPVLAQVMELGPARCLSSVVIDTTGAPERVSAIGCNKVFRKAIKAALLASRWEPARKGGDVVRASFRHRVGVTPPALQRQLDKARSPAVVEGGLGLAPPPMVAELFPLPMSCTVRITQREPGQAPLVTALDCPRPYRDLAERAFADWRWATPADPITWDGAQAKWSGLIYKVTWTDAQSPFEATWVGGFWPGGPMVRRAAD
ncbi:MAG: hypothetical protein AB8H79_07475 [Myxococcota bacterium]